MSPNAEYSENSATNKLQNIKNPLNTLLQCVCVCVWGSISINSLGIYKKDQSTRLSIGLQHNVVVNLIPNISKTIKKKKVQVSINGSTNAS